MSLKTSTRSEKVNSKKTKDVFFFFSLRWQDFLLFVTLTDLYDFVCQTV